MKKPYLISIFGFLGLCSIELINLVLLAMSSLEISIYLENYYRFAEWIYPYFLLTFQILIMLGFLIFYLETKRIVGLLVFLFGLAAIIFPILISPYGALFGYITNDHNIWYYCVSIFILAPLFPLAFYIALGVGFIVINRLSTPRFVSFYVAGTAIFLSVLFMFICDLFNFYELYIMYISGPPPPDFFDIKLVLTFFSIICLFIACIGSISSLMKLKLGRSQITQGHLSLSRLRMKPIMIIIFWGFVLTASIIGFISLSISSEPIWIIHAIVFAPILIFLSIYATKSLIDNHSSGIFASGIMFQGILAYILALFFTFFWLYGYFSLDPLLISTVFLLFGLGYIFLALFPWLNTLTLHQIRAIDIQKVLKYTLLCNIPILVVLPGTRLILISLGFGYSIFDPWTLIYYLNSIQTQVILFLSTLLLPISYMLYQAYRQRLSMHNFLQQFSQSLWQISGIIIVAISIFFCIFSVISPYFICAILLVSFGIGFIVIGSRRQTNIPTQAIIFSFFSILFFFIFIPSALHNSMFIIGGVILIITLNYSILTAVNRVYFAPSRPQPSPVQPPHIPKPTLPIPIKLTGLPVKLPSSSLIISNSMKQTLFLVASAKKYEQTIQTLKFQKEKILQKAILDEQSVKEYQTHMKQMNENITYYENELAQIYAQMDTPLLNSYKRLKTIDETLEKLEALLKQNRIKPQVFDLTEDQIRFEQLSLKQSMRQRVVELLQLKTIIQTELQTLQSQRVELINLMNSTHPPLSRLQQTEVQRRFQALIKQIDTCQEYLSALKVLQKAFQ